MAAVCPYPKPRPQPNAGAKLFRHKAQKFALLIPAHLRAFPFTTITIGPVVLTLCAGDKTITGRVPASWLVGLNADSAVTVEHDASEASPELW